MSLLSPSTPHLANHNCRLDDGFLVGGSNLNENYGPGYRAAATETERRWLANTRLLQHDHPRIRLLALRLTQLKGPARDKALACYQFVRKLPFTCAADAPHTPSVEVLAARAGDSYTKSTLLVAMLRSLGIAARVRVVVLKAQYLRGLMDIGDHAVEHVFCEVALEGEWLGVDSYAVDLELGLVARTRLLREARRSGYGVHMKGQVTWDGASSSFGLFSCADPSSLPMQDLGVFDDVGHFHESTGHHLRPSWARKQEWALAAALANRRIRKLRGTADAAVA